MSPEKRTTVFFPDPIVILPKEAPHTSTVIFLHGRGQTAQYFHEPFLKAHLPSYNATLRDTLPRTRFVFPTSPLSRATKYRKSLIRQWYDGSGDWEPEALGGMGPSLEHVRYLIDKEVELVGGDAAKVILGGFSQGCAMALMSLLLWDRDPLGAVVGISGFIPLNAHMTDILDDDGHSGNEEDSGGVVFASDSDSAPTDELGPLERAVLALGDEAGIMVHGPPTTTSFPKTPVFLAHGTEDPEIDKRHAHLTAGLLEKMSIRVRLRMYPGLGHECAPVVLDDVVSFLKTSFPSG